MKAPKVLSEDAQHPRAEFIRQRSRPPTDLHKLKLHRAKVHFAENSCFLYEVSPQFIIPHS